MQMTRSESLPAHEALIQDQGLPGPESLGAQNPGVQCVLCAMPHEGRLGQRLADMGFCPGVAVRVVRRAPLGDPLEVDLDGTRICIRAAEAEHLLVRPAAQQDRPLPEARP